MDLSGMDTSFDENVDIAEVYAMFTPEIIPDNEVVVSVKSVPYITEIWTDEEPLVFEVLASAGSPSTDPQNTTIDSDNTPLSSGGGCNAGLNVAWQH